MFGIIFNIQVHGINFCPTRYTNCVSCNLKTERICSLLIKRQTPSGMSTSEKTQRFTSCGFSCSIYCSHNRHESKTCMGNNYSWNNGWQLSPVATDITWHYCNGYGCVTGLCTTLSLYQTFCVKVLLEIQTKIIDTCPLPLLTNELRHKKRIFCHCNK